MRGGGRCSGGDLFSHQASLFYAYFTSTHVRWPEVSGTTPILREAWKCGIAECPGGRGKHIGGGLMPSCGEGKGWSTLFTFPPLLLQPDVPGTLNCKLHEELLWRALTNLCLPPGIAFLCFTLSIWHWEVYEGWRHNALFLWGSIYNLQRDLDFSPKEWISNAKITGLKSKTGKVEEKMA